MLDRLTPAERVAFVLHDMFDLPFEDIAGIVGRTPAGRARAARPATVDGHPALVWAPGGQPRVVFRFTLEDGKIAANDLVADPERLAAVDVVLDP